MFVRNEIAAFGGDPQKVSLKQAINIEDIS